MAGFRRPQDEALHAQMTGQPPAQRGFRTAADKPMGVGEDFARSAGTGALQGVAGLMGSAGDLSTMLREAPGAGLRWLEDHGAMPRGSAENWDKTLHRGAAFTPTSLIATAVKAANKAVAPHIGMTPEQATQANRVVGDGTTLPTTRDIEAASGIDKVYHTPQTRAGRYARTTAQFLPAAATGGGALRRIANVVAPGVASEAAGEATAGSPMEPYARLAAAVLGSTGVALAVTPHPTTRILAQASQGATDNDLAAARDLREAAAQRGITLTQAEAMQQVTGNGTGMGRLQRVLEGTRTGSEVIGPIMARRPGEVSGAVNHLADAISPATADPYTLGTTAQGAADDVLTGVRQQINRNARPFYDALPGETMPPTPAAQAAMAGPAYQEALGAVRGNPVLNRDIAQLPDNNLAVTNEVSTQLGTMAENARPNPAASTGNAKLSAGYDAAKGTIDDLAGAYSGPYRIARAMVRTQNEQFLDPLKAGPMGAISRTPKVGAQTGALFPSTPAEGAAGPTRMTMEMLPDDVARALARQHIMNTFNEGSKNLQSGPNQWGGAKFAARIAGNPEQRAVLQAGVEGAGADRPAVDDLLAALEATGKRQAAGSQTAYNVEELRNLGEAGAVGTTVKAVASGPATFRKIGDALQDWQMGRNANGLAEAITADPAHAQEILMEARRRVQPGALRSEVERLMLTAAQARLAAPADH